MMSRKIAVVTFTTWRARLVTTSIYRILPRIYCTSRICSSSEKKQISHRTVICWILSTSITLSWRYVIPPTLTRRSCSFNETKWKKEKYVKSYLLFPLIKYLKDSLNFTLRFLHNCQSAFFPTSSTILNFHPSVNWTHYFTVVTFMFMLICSPGHIIIRIIFKQYGTFARIHRTSCQWLTSWRIHIWLYAR